jgi:hypothetical protein
VSKPQHQDKPSSRPRTPPLEPPSNREGGQDGAREENTQGYDPKPDRAGQRLGDNPPSE